MSNLVSNKNLMRLHEEFGFTFIQIGQTLGLGNSTTSRWHTDGKMPQWASIACEALLRRQGKNGADRRCILIIRIDSVHRETISKLVEALDGSAVLLEEQ